MLERVDHLLILLWEQSLPHTIYITVGRFSPFLWTSCLERSKGVSAPVTCLFQKLEGWRFIQLHKKCHIAPLSAIPRSWCLWWFVSLPSSSCRFPRTYLILDKDSIDPDARRKIGTMGAVSTRLVENTDGTSSLMSIRSCGRNSQISIPWTLSPRWGSVSRIHATFWVFGQDDADSLTWLLGWNEHPLTPCKGWIYSTITGTGYR